MKSLPLLAAALLSSAAHAQKATLVFDKLCAVPGKLAARGA